VPYKVKIDRKREEKKEGLKGTRREVKKILPKCP
jgi:hypothetical protein